MQWLIFGLASNLVAFVCFIMSARVEWSRIKPRYDPKARRVLPGGKWVHLPINNCDVYHPYGRGRYNLAVIAQWVSLAIFVYTVFQWPR